MNRLLAASILTLFAAPALAVTYPIIGTVDVPTSGGGVSWTEYACSNTSTDAVGISAAIVTAVGASHRLHLTGNCSLTGPVNVTNIQGLIIQGDGMQGTVLNAASGFPTNRTMIDLTGSLHVVLRDFRIGYYNQGTVAVPQSAIQMAQVPSNQSNVIRLDGLYISGSYSLATVDDYGVPSSSGSDDEFYNYYPDPGKHPVLRWENSNAMGLTSQFTTVATGPLSAGDWTWTASEFHRFGGGASAGYETVSLDGIEGWNQFGGNMSGGAVSYLGIYGANKNINLIGTTMETESEPRTPIYSVYSYPGSSTAGLVISNCLQVNVSGTFGGPGSHT